MTMFKNQKGQSLIELLIAMGVFVLAVSATSFLIIDAYISDRTGRERTQATFLAEEGLEAVRSIRDNNWNDLTAGNHGLAASENSWAFSGDQEDIGSQLRGGVRKIIVEDVDSNRKKVTSQITWNLTETRSQEVDLVTYLTYWRAAGVGDWSQPMKLAALNQPCNQDGLKIQVQGDYAYLVRGAGTPNFVIINIVDPANPTIIGTLNLNGAPTNIAVSGDYAYVSSANNNQEFQIIDISNPDSPHQIGFYNASGSADGQGVFVAGTKAYLVRISSASREFLVINVTTPSSPHLLGQLELGATGYEVWVSGNYAYVASSHNNRELLVINISNPAAPFLAGAYNAAGNTDALTVAGFGSTVLLGQNKWIRIVNVATPSNPAILGTFTSTRKVNDIALDFGAGNTHVFFATQGPGAEFEVIDVSQLSNPVLVGSLDLGSGLNGIAYDAARDRVCAASASNKEEFLIIAPQ